MLSQTNVQEYTKNIFWHKTQSIENFQTQKKKCVLQAEEQVLVDIFSSNYLIIFEFVNAMTKLSI